MTTRRTDATAPPANWLGRRVRGVAHACRGLADGVASEAHMRVHLVATLAVLATGLACGLERLEWALLALACGGVWVAELINTALERLADALHAGPHPLVGRAKDLAAAAVFVAAWVAVGVALAVLGPHLVPA